MACHLILLRLNPSANLIIDVNTPNETATTSKANNISYNTHQKEKVAFKLSFSNDKKARCESHYAFLTRCQKENIIPDSLKVYLEPSISNHSEEFLNN